jgi:hypothetical protein
MKTFFAIIAAFVLSLGALQAQDYLATDADYKAFLNTRTLVVMDQNPMSDFNFKIRDVMKRHWKVTPFDFISEQEFEKKKDDPSYSFLLTTTVTFDIDKTKARYTFLSLLMGKQGAKVTNMPDLISIPLSYVRVEESSYSYKMDAFVRFVQDHVKLMLANPGEISKNPLKYYNRNVKSLAGKTLLLAKRDLQNTVDTEAKIKKVYPYNVRIVDEDEIMEAIERQDPDVVFLHKVGPEGGNFKARCYKIIIGAADSQFYYFDYHTIDKSSPDRLLLKDLKKMGS